MSLTRAMNESLPRRGAEHQGIEIITIPDTPPQRIRPTFRSRMFRSSSTTSASGNEEDQTDCADKRGRAEQREQIRSDFITKAARNIIATRIPGAGGRSISKEELVEVAGAWNEMSTREQHVFRRNKLFRDTIWPKTERPPFEQIVEDWKAGDKDLHEKYPFAVSPHGDFYKEILDELHLKVSKDICRKSKTRVPLNLNQDQVAPAAEIGQERSKRQQPQIESHEIRKKARTRTREYLSSNLNSFRTSLTSARPRRLANNHEAQQDQAIADATTDPSVANIDRAPATEPSMQHAVGRNRPCKCTLNPNIASGAVLIPGFRSLKENEFTIDVLQDNIKQIVECGAHSVDLLNWANTIYPCLPK